MENEPLLTYLLWAAAIGATWVVFKVARKIMIAVLAVLIVLGIALFLYVRYFLP